MTRSEAHTCGIVDQTYDDIAELELLVLKGCGTIMSGIWSG